jgi:hypothetical protein
MLAAPLVLGARVNRQDPTVFMPLAVTVLVWAFVPAAVLNTWFLYQRFALFLLPFYAVIFRPPQPARRGIVQMLWLPAVCWAFLALYSERLLVFAKESAAFDDVLAVTEPGHRALGLIFNPASAALDNVQAYWHFPVWYQAEKDGLVDFSAAGFLPQVVRYRPDRVPAGFAGPTWQWRSAETFDWTNGQAEIYRYFFVRSTAPLLQGYLPMGRCEPVLLKSAGDWSVYENVSCHSAFLSGARAAISFGHVPLEDNRSAGVENAATRP